MKTKITFLSLLLNFAVLVCFSQNIEFTFENTQITNDGVDDFYETDVMITAIDGQADFKLGKGLLYINYNTAAFGNNIASGGIAEITYPNPNYILGDVSGFPYYTDFTLANNTDSRIAFSFQQGISSGSMPTENVLNTPKRLFHLKIKYLDPAIDPMVVFEDNETQPPGVNDCRDQFFTACGPSSPGFPDCNADPGMQFLNALFTSSGATLSQDAILKNTTASVYPNPTNGSIFIKSNNNLKSVTIYDITGKIVLDRRLESSQLSTEINLSSFTTGLYIVSLESHSSTINKRIIKN